jgi:hypothetical protein
MYLLGTRILRLFWIVGENDRRRLATTVVGVLWSRDSPIAVVGWERLLLSIYFPFHSVTMSVASNANESYCTFTLAPDVTAGGLPSEEEIAKDMESTDDAVRSQSLVGVVAVVVGPAASPLRL